MMLLNHIEMYSINDINDQVLFGSLSITFISKACVNSFAESVTFGSLCSVVGSNLEFSLNVFFKLNSF